MLSKVKRLPLLQSPELLSPAGDWESLKSAIQNGADAVYLGVRDFNARLYARNFTVKELGRVVSQAHSHGVKVYLTLNTLVKNHEVPRFFSVLSGVYQAGADGVIIQHVSFLEIIKRNFPGLKVFISTQGAIGNLYAASVVGEADRIILPRELSFNEIKKFVNAGYRVEVFVHGALCYSYSGMCLFSSFVSSRSGNRGSCAQLCRQRYNGEYPLSTRELCLVRRIPELIEAGIEGFKIEGRMRSPLYVAVATRLYRKAIDSYLKGNFVLPAKEMAEIEVVFNREFTEGLIFGDKELVSPQKPMNRGAFLGECRNGEVVLNREVAVGDGVGIWQEENVTGSVIREIYVSGRSVLTAPAGESVDLGIEMKDGARVFLTSSPRISLQPDFTLKRAPLRSPERKEVSVNLPRIRSSKQETLRLLVKAYSLPEALESARAGADSVFLDIFHPDFPQRHDWHERSGLGAYLPRIMSDAQLSTAVSLLKSKSPAAVLTGNPGFLAAGGGLDIPVFLDYSLNTYNDIDIRFYRKNHATPVISPELSLNELGQFQDKSGVVFCHGDIVLVNTRIDPATDVLVDEKGSKFRVRRENGYWQILNSCPFGLFDAIHSLMEQGFRRFYIDWEGKGAQAVRLYLKLVGHGQVSRRARKGFTSGHLYTPVI